MTVTQHIGAAAVAIAFGIAAVLPASQRNVPIDILEAVVVTPVVAPGDDLLIRFTVDREKVCPTTAYVTLFDGANIEWRVAPETRPAFGPPGVETRIVRHAVPPGATPGLARYRLVLDFECNWTHRIAPVTLIYHDLGFEIGEAS